MKTKNRFRQVALRTSKPTLRPSTLEVHEAVPYCTMFKSSSAGRYSARAAVHVRPDVGGFGRCVAQTTTSGSRQTAHCLPEHKPGILAGTTHHRRSCWLKMSMQSLNDCGEKALSPLWSVGGKIKRSGGSPHRIGSKGNKPPQRNMSGAIE